MYAADYMGDISGHWHCETGLIAQNILQISDLSYCVKGGDYIDKTGNLVEKSYSLIYDDIFVYNIAATKELDAKNTALEARVATQEIEINILHFVELSPVQTLRESRREVANAPYVQTNQYACLLQICPENPRNLALAETAVHRPNRE